MKINSKQLLLVCNKYFEYYDPRLINHGQRVAYIAKKLADNFKYKDELDYSVLALLSIFHDVGAYKTDIVDNLLQFETFNIHSHSIYGYLFLKYFTPLSKYSEAVLYHHSSESEIGDVDELTVHYSQLIRMADRIDIGFFSGRDMKSVYKALISMNFSECYVQALSKTFEKFDLFDDIKSLGREKLIKKVINGIDISKKDAINYLEMLVNSIDFKSDSTVIHCTTTVIISIFLCEKENFSKEMINDMYYASLLHDIGKGAIPTDILEFPGRLSNEDMVIMRHHVVYTHEILSGIIPENIVLIATRHHEKLNGKGYPFGLCEEDLSESDKILAVADIASALLSKRSYKEGFSWQNAFTILTDMANDNLIDKKYVDLIISNKSELEVLLEEKSKPIKEIYTKIKKEYNEMDNSIL